MTLFNSIDPASHPLLEDQRLLALAKKRNTAATLIAVTNLAVETVFLIVLVYVLFMAATALPKYLTHDWTANPGLENALEYVGVYIAVWAPVVIYLGIFLLPFLLTLPLSAPIVALWQKPPRFIFLRPFNRTQASASLRKLIRRDLAGLGHTYTLSDADIRVPWYVRFPLLVGQLALFSFRMRRVRTSAQLVKVVEAIDRTWLRNVNWCLSWNKIFPIACVDSLWQECVGRLLRKMDVVCIDLTDLRSNVIWEVNLCRKLHIDDRVVYLASAEQAADVGAKLKEALGDTLQVGQIHTYTKIGLIDRPRFRAEIIRVIQATRTPEASEADNRLSVVATVFFMLGLLPLLALPFPNVAGDLGLPRWTGWEHPAHWPGVAAVTNVSVITVLAYGLVSLALLLMASRNNRCIRFLLVLQVLLLLAAPIGMLDW